MKFLAYFLLCAIGAESAVAQRVQTLALDTLVKGTAFQVQYIVRDAGGLVNIIPPSFDSLRVISGPYHYKGSVTRDGKKEPIENITYTLVPLVKGVVRIGGITAQFQNNLQVRSQDLFPFVIDPPQASYRVRSTTTDVGLFGTPGSSSLNKLIADNIFINTAVSKKSVYQGEPLMVTFKLYSAFQSSSEATKAPGLYGFSVMDMVDINQPHIGVEKLGTRVYNTAVLRQMQLYPVSAGRLVIDPMYLANTIVIKDSLHKGKETQIVREIASSPIQINVHPLPPNQPENYTGAVGQFQLFASLKETNLSLNQEGTLRITIQGSGNFIQFGLPVIKPPTGIYFTETKVSEELNKGLMPEQGKRTYQILFTADSPGTFSLLPVTFSFFDVKQGVYKTIRSDTLRVNFRAARFSKIAPAKKRYHVPGLGWLIALSILVFVTVIVSLSRKKVAVLPGQIKEAKADGPNHPSQVEAIALLPDKEFFSALRPILTNYMLVNEGKILPEAKEAIHQILKECDLLVYSQLTTHDKKQELKNKVLQLLAG